MQNATYNHKALKNSVRHININLKDEIYFPSVPFLTHSLTRPTISSDHNDTYASQHCSNLL